MVPASLTQHTLGPIQNVDFTLNSSERCDELGVPGPSLDPVITSITPGTQQGGSPFILQIHGENLNVGRPLIQFHGWTFSPIRSTATPTFLNYPVPGSRDGAHARTDSDQGAERRRHLEHVVTADAVIIPSEKRAAESGLGRRDTSP